MLTKQFWKIHHNPQSLLARIYKAKYFSRGPIQDYCLKPHHSWFWKNIIKQDCPALREWRWWIGDGYNIPLKHKDWVQWSPLNLQDDRLPIGTIKDLINHTSASWNVIWSELSIPLIWLDKSFNFPFLKQTLFRTNWFGNTLLIGSIMLRRPMRFLTRSTCSLLITIIIIRWCGPNFGKWKPLWK